MKITSRRTSEFIDLSVDEIETTIFKSSQNEIQNHIDNLLEVIEDLKSYLGQ